MYGLICKKEPTSVHIDINGIIYELNISVNCFQEIKNDNQKFIVKQIFKEDGVSLYGFIDKAEQKMFENLLKISGVGPKAAMAICSSFTPSSFAKILTAKDVTLLKKAPGIGPKTALRIVTELGDINTITAISITDDKNMESIMALESLGFRRDEILKVINGLEANSTGEIVKLALQKLQRL
jgi:Holliday junction DNA helicase RuvA